MRRTAYIQALKEVNEFPTCIPELQTYFKNVYDPRQKAIQYIITTARLDNKGLTHGEFGDIYEYSKNLIKPYLKNKL